MSIWVKHGFERRVRAILKDIKYRKKEHHLGRPFITEYQLGILFKKRYPSTANAIPYPHIGGKGSGVFNSLPQYLAKELSSRIKSGEITDIEGGFLSKKHINDMHFLDNEGNIIEPSINYIQIYRLKD